MICRTEDGVALFADTSLEHWIAIDNATCKPSLTSIARKCGNKS